MRKQRTCWIDGCYDKAVKWGMCSAHQEHWELEHPRKHTGIFGADEDRFLFYTETDTSGCSDWSSRLSGCWHWLGALSENGYGIISLTGSGNRKSGRAHRYACRRSGLVIPDGFEVDHLCRVRPCVNPKHLEAVPQIVNNRRGTSASVSNAKKTHCPQGHPYDEENTKISSSGSRLCRTCIREHNAKRYQGIRRRRGDAPDTCVSSAEEKTHCPAGHPYSGENLIVEKRKRPDSTERDVRRCRTCVNAKARKNHVQRKAQPDNRRSDETCRNGHPRTEETTAIRGGKRRCKICLNEASKASYHRTKNK